LHVAPSECTAASTSSKWRRGLKELLRALTARWNTRGGDFMRTATNSRRSSLRVAALSGLLLAALFGGAERACGQASVGDVSISPFVIGYRTIVNNGAVGGVSIDAKGVVNRAEVDALGDLKQERLKALQEVPGDLNRPSKLRKVSLRRLEAAVAAQRVKGEPLPDDLLHLAGLQRIQFVFLYPDEHDVVLAGPAEGWKVNESGDVVGVSSDRPVLRLEDLIVALRAGESSFKTPITCSIHPTQEGVARLQRQLASPSLRMSKQTIIRLEKTLGPQEVVVEGVPATSRFARVLVAADFQMKRLAMGLEKPPIHDLPSYLDLLTAAGERPESMTPRWWLAPDYQPLARDAQGLAFEIRGPGVATMTEDGLLAETGQLVGAGKESPLAKKWAETFTAKYNELSAELCVFADLRNCMDMAVVAALLVREDVRQSIGFELPLLMDAKRIALSEHHMPRQVASTASFVKSGKDWLVTISGGVEMTGWPVIEREEGLPALDETRRSAAAGDAKRWWWD
jgi:hypothetical protein